MRVIFNSVEGCERYFDNIDNVRNIGEVLTDRSNDFGREFEYVLVMIKSLLKGIELGLDLKEVLIKSLHFHCSQGLAIYVKVILSQIPTDALKMVLITEVNENNALHCAVACPMLNLEMITFIVEVSRKKERKKERFTEMTT